MLQFNVLVLLVDDDAHRYLTQPERVHACERYLHNEEDTEQQEHRRLVGNVLGRRDIGGVHFTLEKERNDQDFSLT